MIPHPTGVHMLDGRLGIVDSSLETVLITTNVEGEGEGECSGLRARLVERLAHQFH